MGQKLRECSKNGESKRKRDINGLSHEMQMSVGFFFVLLRHYKKCAKS